MAESTNTVSEIKENQTTSVAENSQAVQEQPTNSEQAAQEQPQSPFGNWMIWIMLALWGWWLWSSSKNRKKKKAEEAKLQTLEKGDKIITIDRMHATIVAFTDTTITVKTDDKSNATMTFDRQAIFKRLPRPGEEAAADEAKKA